MDLRVKRFLESPSFAVVGASVDRSKFGNKVLRSYQQNDLQVLPVHPKAEVIEGLKAVEDVSLLPKETKSISIITPPAITDQVVKLAIASGIENIWMQPGAQSANSVAICQQAGINFIADGSCFLVVMGFDENG